MWKPFLLLAFMATSLAFPNPQDDDQSLLGDIENVAKDAERYGPAEEGIDPATLAEIFGTSEPVKTFDVVEAEEDEDYGSNNVVNNGVPKDILVDDAFKQCASYANSGYRCVPYYSCDGGEIIIDGAGLFNPRFGALDDVELNPETSKCPGAFEMCCRHPDWFGLDILTPINITKPNPDITIHDQDDDDVEIIDENPDYPDHDGPFNEDPEQPEYPDDGIKGADTDLDPNFYNQFVECDNDDDCPEKCNIMLSPTSSGKAGYCVPYSCSTDSDCPKIGDECNGGAIGATCSNSYCDYDKAVLVANCIQEPEFGPEFYKEALECDTNADCPFGKDQCNIMASSTSSGKAGYCVPNACSSDSDCPDVGDECISGVLGGTCQDNYCSYDKFVAIATCIQDGVKDADDGTVVDPQNPSGYPIEPQTPINPNPTNAGYRPQCGQRNPNGIGVRISHTDANDRSTQFAEWPHMCAVLERTVIAGTEHSLYVCGGSLIAPNVVLTAAHCIDKVSDVQNLMVRCGEWDTQDEVEPVIHQDRNALDIMIHPAFDKRSLQNDFGIIVLQEPFELARHIDTICLPDQFEPYQFDWNSCVATGWGKDTFGKEGEYQVVMKQVELNMVDHDTCQDKLRQTRLGEFFELHDSFNCAGGEAGKDTCTGDGGGPLVCQGNDGRYYQSGIIAWGVECGISEVPGVYANVTEGLCFIDYATKCVLGQDADLYGLQGCNKWAKRKYCEIKDEISVLDELIADTNELKLKGKLFRKKRNMNKLLPGLENALLRCDPDYQGLDVIDVDCNNYDYFPDLTNFARNKSEEEEEDDGSDSIDPRQPNTKDIGQ